MTLSDLKSPFPFEALGVNFTIPAGVFLYLYLTAIANAVVWSTLGLVEAVKVVF